MMAYQQKKACVLFKKVYYYKTFSGITSLTLDCQQTDTTISDTLMKSKEGSNNQLRVYE